MEDALRANSQNVREQYEHQLENLREAYGEAMLALRARKNSSPYWARTRSDRDDPQGLQADGITVSIAKPCRCFGAPRHMVY